MTVAFRPDMIEVNVTLCRERVADIDIVGRRPIRFDGLARGRSPDDVAGLLPRLFVLCATAQSVAGITAIEAARGTAASDARLRQRAAVVAVERMSELLRGTLMTLAGEDVERVAPALRQALTATHAFSKATEIAPTAIDALDQALAAAGLPSGSFADAEAFERWFESASPVAGYIRPLLLDGANFVLALDPLDADADIVVGERLRAGGAAFAAQPDLDDRTPETGAFARNAGDALLAALDIGDAAAARLLARLIEVRATPDLLRRLLGGDTRAADAIVHGYRLDERLGLAAVECARGRLHHLVGLDGEGRVERFEILAPTEWNFHPEGPLTRALRGATVGAHGVARGAIERLVAAFDPCVAHRVNLAEAAHA
jgi:Ni,Fe-hydrogenase III large subunit